MIKKILIGVAVLLVILAGGAYFVYSNIEGYIKTALETYGSEATQSQVKVGDVKLSVRSGEGGLSGIVIGNPKGYSTANAFSLGLASLKVDIDSVAKNPVVIKEIVIDRPHIVFEMGGDGSSNLQAIQKNLNAYAAKMGAGGGGAPAQKPAAGAKEPERKLVIENLYVRNGQIAASHSLLKGQIISSSLPTIHLTNIGKAKGGATPAEIANEVIGAISQQANKAAMADVTKSLDALKGKVGEAVGEALGGALGKRDAGGVGDQLRGILGR